MPLLSKETLDNFVPLLEAIHFDSGEFHHHLDNYDADFNIYMDYLLRQEAKDKGVKLEEVKRHYIDSIFSSFRIEGFSLETIAQLLEYEMVNTHWSELCTYFPFKVSSDPDQKVQLSSSEALKGIKFTYDQTWKIALLTLTRNLFPDLKEEKERMAKLPYEPKYLSWALDNELYHVFIFMLDHYQLGAEEFTARDNLAFRKVFKMENLRAIAFIDKVFDHLKNSIDPNDKYNLYGNALLVAVNQGSTEMVEYLCTRFNFKDLDLAQPMVLKALQNKDYPTAIVLVKHFKLGLIAAESLKYLKGIDK